MEKSECDKLKAKVERQEETIKLLRYKITLIKMKKKRDEKDSQSKKSLLDDNRALEKINQSLREKMSKMQGLYVNSESYI